jgi:putative hydrolase of the HAD superfamily
MAKKLTGITFDFDATFYNYPRMVAGLIHKYGWHTKLIYDMTKARKGIRKECPIENFRERQVQVMAKKWHKSEDWTRAKLDRVVYNGFNSDFDKVKPVRGVFEMLDMVVANKIPMCVVSDYPPHDKLQKMGFMKYPWKTIINGEDIGVLKPHPKGLLTAMGAMGSAPETTLHVGDSLKFDIRGANELGMYSAWLQWWWKRPKPGIVPDYTFRNFYELQDIFVREFGLKRKM